MYDFAAIFGQYLHHVAVMYVDLCCIHIYIRIHLWLDPFLSRSKASGHASLQLQFSHWEVLQEEPFPEACMTEQVRKAQNLNSRT